VVLAVLHAIVVLVKLPRVTIYVRVAATVVVRVILLEGRLCDEINACVSVGIEKCWPIRSCQCVIVCVRWLTINGLSGCLVDGLTDNCSLVRIVRFARL
jgi:hypothetical protein